MWNFLFVFDGENSELSGEQIFVQRETWEEADEFMFAEFAGEHFYYAGRFTDEEAEEMGFDTY